MHDATAYIVQVRALGQHTVQEQTGGWRRTGWLAGPTAAATPGSNLDSLDLATLQLTRSMHVSVLRPHLGLSARLAALSVHTPRTPALQQCQPGLAHQSLKHSTSAVSSF